MPHAKHLAIEHIFLQKHPNYKTKPIELEGLPKGTSAWVEPGCIAFSRTNLHHGYQGPIIKLIVLAIEDY